MRPLSSFSSSFFTAFTDWPTEARSSLLSLPMDLSISVREPLLPKTETLRDSISDSSFAAFRRSSVSCLIF